MDYFLFQKLGVKSAEFQEDLCNIHNKIKSELANSFDINTFPSIPAFIFLVQSIQRASLLNVRTHLVFSCDIQQSQTAEKLSPELRTVQKATA